MNWFFIWLALYLIIIFILTLSHVKSTRLEAYLVNNRNTSTFPLVLTTLATFVGGGTSIGLMAMGYESGFAAVGIGIAYVIGFFKLAHFAGKIRDKGKEFNIYSFPHFLSHKFIDDPLKTSSKLFTATVSGVNIFIFFFLLSAQFVGMATLIQYAFEFDYLTASIISCLVVILYTTIAGLSGVIVTDMVQFFAILLMIAFIFLPGIWEDTDQLNRLSEFPANMLNGSFYGWIFLIALPLFLAPSVLVRMDLWQRVLAARDKQTAKRMSLWSAAGMLPFYIIFPLVGMSIRLISGDALDSKDVTYLFINRHANAFWIGFAVVGLLSALMSSGDSFLNLISISAINDFKNWRKKKIQPKRMHREIRVATIIFGVIAMIQALAFPKIVDLMVVGIGTIVIFVPVTLLALLRKDVKTYKKIALLSIGSGFIVNLFFFTLGVFSPETFEPKSSFIPAFIVGGLVLLIGIKTKKHA